LARIFNKQINNRVVESLKLSGGGRSKYLPLKRNGVTTLVPKKRTGRLDTIPNFLKPIAKCLL